MYGHRSRARRVRCSRPSGCRARVVCLPCDFPQLKRTFYAGGHAEFPGEGLPPTRTSQNYVISRHWIRHGWRSIIEAMRALGFALVLLWATTGSALAEKVKTNQETRVLKHPNEQGKLVIKVKVCQQMSLIVSEGRWLHVRVSGRTGWVARSKVELADPDEIARNTRRRPFVAGRSTHRGFGSSEAPEDRIGADAVGGGDAT